MEKNNGINNTQGKTNSLAIAGFVVAMASLFLNFYGIVGLVATVLSAVGLSKVKETGTGKGFAIAGLIVGIISILWGVFVILFLSVILSNLL